MKYKQGDKVRWTNSGTFYRPLIWITDGIVVGALDPSEFDLDEVGQMYVVAIADGDIHAFEDELEGVYERLEYLRGEIEAERISMGEIIELEELADEGLIPDHELDLLQWANVPEFGDARARASRNV